LCDPLVMKDLLADLSLVMSALPILPLPLKTDTHAIKLTAVYCTVCQQAK
jgi:hypothetical protein